MTNINAFGTKLKRGSATGTAIAQVTNISGPGLSADAIDVTSHDSTSGYREFLQGLKDGGEISLDLNFDPVLATHDKVSGGVLDDFNTGTAVSWYLVFTDAATSTWNFSGITTGFELEAPMDDKLAATVTIKVTGVPTLT